MIFLQHWLWSTVKGSVFTLLQMLAEYWLADRQILNESELGGVPRWRAFNRI
jgi:hypothetical protein